MYRKELENLLQSPKFPNYFMLFGSEEFQIEEYGKEILKIYKPDANAEICTLYFDEYDFELAKSALCEQSLFSQNQILHIKTDKKIPKKELEIFINTCKKNENSHFLYEFYESDMKVATEPSKMFESNFVRFFAPSSPNEAVLLLAKKASNLGLDITNSALYQIYSIHNENLYLSASELEKLAMLNKKIDENIVKELVFSLTNISFDEFFAKLISQKDINEIFFDYFDDTNSQIAFINQLYTALFRLFKLHCFVKIHGHFDIKAAIGYQPPANIAKILQNQALSMDLQTYKALFVHINEVEFELKSNPKLDITHFLLYSLLKFQKIIANNRKI